MDAKQETRKLIDHMLTQECPGISHLVSGPVLDYNMYHCNTQTEGHYWVNIKLKAVPGLVKRDPHPFRWRYNPCSHGREHEVDLQADDRRVALTVDPTHIILRFHNRGGVLSINRPRLIHAILVLQQGITLPRE